MRHYQIAGLTVAMELFGRTEAQAKPYLCPVDGPADITITCDARRLLDLNPSLESEDVTLYIATGILFAQKLLPFEGTYLHASAVVLEGKAYLFSAHSGTGKSTHTEKWCRLFGAEYLNDDKPALRFFNSQWTAYGTPWSGKHDLSSPQGAPVGGIAFLKRGAQNSIRRLTAQEAVPLFVGQSLWRLPKHEQMEQQLRLVDRLVQQVPIWELTCRNDDDAAILAHDAMT